jgi:PAS domain S-box-containing protein
MLQRLEQIQDIFNHAPFGACVFDAQGVIVYANPRFCSAIFENGRPVTGASVYDGIPSLLLDEGLTRNIRELIENDKSFSLTIETYSTPRVRESGLFNIFGYRLEHLFILICEPIGGLARDTRYRNLILEAPDIIIVMRYGAITFCNKAFIDMLQLTLDEILGRQIFEFFDASQAEPLQILKHDNIKEFATQVIANTPKGLRMLDGRFHSIQENPGMSLAVLRDVTEKVALEKKLVRQNQDLTVINMISETLSSSISMEEVLQSTLGKILQIMNIETGWIFLLNEQKNTLRCAYAHGLPDYVVEDIKELRVGEGIAGRVAATGEAIIIENASQDMRIKSLVSKMQGIKSFASIPLKSRTRLIGVMNLGTYGERDLTRDDKRLLMSMGLHMGAVIENILLFNEVSKTSEDLKNALITIEQRNEELKGLVYTVSHDLKNPIIAINGFCNRLLKTAVSNLTEKDFEYLRAIQESGKHMEAFVTNLLTLSAVEDQKVEEETFSVQDIIGHIAMEQAVQLDEKRGTIDIESDLPVVNADRTRVMQIFSNLISNAIKYSHPERALNIRIGYKPRGMMHVFYVKDNGIGIPSEYAESVFDMFFRAYENVASGTGLGLSIVKKAVNVLGGDIWLESKQDIGSIFYFSIPANG